VASVNSAIKPVLIALIILTLAGSFIYWLWQRQPQNEITENLSISQEEADSIEIEPVVSELIPPNAVVLDSTSITFQGKTQANFYIVVSSNTTLGITQADEKGQFELEAELIDGLSLVDIYILDTNLIEKEIISRTLYVSEESSASRVLAGPVKGIFDNIITITSIEGEQTIRQKSSTDVIFPESEDEGNDIRVGDYLIALGSVENEKDFDAQTIEIIRSDKPQNLEKYVAGTLLSGVKENIFSIRNQQDSDIVELTLNDDSTLTLSGDEAETEDIIKDSLAIILYYREKGENITDLVFLLP